MAAILAADVAGYSRLIGLDEEGTLARLKSHRRELIDPKIAEHKGRVVKTTGDGILIEFPSVVAALRCAVEVQRGMVERNAGEPADRRIEFRVGIHQGDIVVDDTDILGDGVNVAARLEGIAEPGGICISARVHEDAAGRLDLRFEDMGEQQLKNIARSVRVYRVALGDRRVATSPGETLALPDKPSIAVLPFTNMSGDTEQEYFVDGLTEDLITDLSRVAGLFVIARNSSFTYKGKSVDVRQVAREMGVRYILEGSARRAAGRVRINAQLIDAIGGGHLWAERFDRDLADVFAVQDDVVRKIVAALVGELTAAKLPDRRWPANLEAHECLVRGRLLHGHSLEAGKAARELFERSVELDNQYAEAHAWLARSYWHAWLLWGEPIEKYKRLAVDTAKRAVALDPTDAMAHSSLGYILLYEREWAKAAAEFDTALRLNPNHAETWQTLTDFMTMEGRPTEAIKCNDKARRLNPRPPGRYYFLLGRAQYAAHHYEEAVATLRREEAYAIVLSRRVLAAALAQLGQVDEAREEAKQFMRANPHFRVSHWAAFEPFRDKAALQHFLDGYIKAGLPE
ncbi:MAG TPA: adenylate/guanylate cyclase domain-containing protein [Stellaceae bacterium]|nr:adenylate/guanylate cyclase domain-containing protein [Stellaceae bacterium]